MVTSSVSVRILTNLAEEPVAVGSETTAVSLCPAGPGDAGTWTGTSVSATGIASGNVSGNAKIGVLAVLVPSSITGG